ncbi:hypothetical protein [Actinospica robiniae]|uniref:hypothetical protein n=1 Tax=Actinospica robiniae TaxID=304901 RepID=UPI0003F53DD3|nr:hypothetical protein [Actinospica robiniae]
MSSQNEGEQPDPAPEPWGAFDAFRARRADDRAQQETQGAYSFPPEYAADPPSPTASGPVDPSAPAVPGGRGNGSGGRLRSIAVLAGAAALAVAVGFGAYEAVGSSGPAANTTTSGAAPTPGAVATATAAAKLGRAVDVRVVIESIGSGSFTGHLLATGEHVTVQLGATTRFGALAHPFSREQLKVGETVLVRGRRSAADVLAATVVLGV